MGARATLQGLITVSGDTSSASVSEAMQIEDWLDCGNWDTGIFTLFVTDVSVTGSDTIDIALKTMDAQRKGLTADEPTGAAWTIKEFTGLSSNQWYKHLATTEQDGSTGTIEPMDRWVFWEVQANKVTGGSFSVTFEVWVTLKGAA